MSRHSTDIIGHSKITEVVVGWDRRMNLFFVDIMDNQDNSIAPLYAPTLDDLIPLFNKTLFSFGIIKGAEKILIEPMRKDLTNEFHGVIDANYARRWPSLDLTAPAAHKYIPF